MKSCTHKMRCKVNILTKFREQAKNNPKRIVFPEGDDDRILQAAAKILRESYAQVFILGNPEKLLWRAGELEIDISKAKLIDPATHARRDEYLNLLVDIRHHKGLTRAAARKLLEHNAYFGTMMVYSGEVDGMVCGATYTTADSLRPALQIIKTKPDVNLVSSFFFMITNEQVFFFADCAFVRHPNTHQLVDIAVATSKSAELFGFTPKVALLSFSTKGSAESPDVTKVRHATKIIQKQFPHLLVDGELQLDAAIVPSVAARKCPQSPVKGEANVLIFPDLNSANIGYKLVQRFSHTKAIGPIVQGLKKPVNDLSRGCSVQDIVDVTVITVIEAQDEN